MSVRKDPKLSVMKALFTKSGNQCAYPECREPVIDDRNILVAEVCHINAVKKQDARWNVDLDDEYLRSYDNLIILCHRHHKRIDALENEYPIQKLKAMRDNHEDLMAFSGFTPSDSAIAQSIFDLTEKSFTWNLEFVADEVEALIKDGLIWAQQHTNRMEQNVCAVLDAQLHFLYLSLLTRLTKNLIIDFISKQEKWEQSRQEISNNSVESHGGSLAALEFSIAYANETRNRISLFRTFLDKGH